jgi:hypothetical protein
MDESLADWMAENLDERTAPSLAGTMGSGTVGKSVYQSAVSRVYLLADQLES